MNKYIDISAITNVIGNVFSNPKLLDMEDKYFFNKEDFIDDFHKTVFGALFNLHQLGAKEVNLNAIEDYLSTRPKKKAIYDTNKGGEYLLRCAENANINTFDYYYNRMKKMTLFRSYNEKVGMDLSYIYDLNNIVSKLNINLYVNIQDIENATKDLKERKVSSLTIPLTEKTVSVDIGDESIVNNNKQIDLVRTTNSLWAISASILFFFVSIIYTMFLILYSRKTRTAQMIYEKEIKSIMSNYDSYIQKINGSYDIGTSQVLKIETFNDMLEIRDTLRQPILMLENEQKNGTFFIIPATNSIIYTYALRVVDIKAKIDGKEIPTYDITEIPHQDFKKKKKYTDEYIKDQITMTTAMKKVDADNVIKGNKDKDTNLYDQLEKTSSYKFKFKK